MKKYLKFLGLPVMAFILWRVDFGELWGVLRECRIELVLAAFALTAGAGVIKALRWLLLLRQQGFHYPFHRAVSVYLAGIFIGIVTPGRVGELARVFYVKRDLGVTAAMGLSSILVDRLWDFYALLLLGVIAAAQFDLLGQASGLFFALVPVLTLAPLLLFSPKVARFFVRRLVGNAAKKKFLRAVSERSEDFFGGVEQLLGWQMILSGLLTLVAYAAIGVSAWLLAVALHIDLRLIDGVLMNGLASFVSLVPVTMAGIGTRDAVFIFIFSTLGLASEQALAMSVLALGVFYFGMGLLGSLFFLSDRPSSRNALAED